MKKAMAIMLLAFLALNVIAQEFEVPANYKFKAKEDYAKYEADILKGIDWLTATPIKTNPDKRKDINAFVLTWLTGSPDVSVEINSDIVNFTESNNELLMIFMCGWTKYSLETKDYTDKVKGNLNGVEAVIDFYTANKDELKKDKNVEKYIKMKENNTLEDFIKGKLK